MDMSLIIIVILLGIILGIICGALTLVIKVVLAQRKAIKDFKNGRMIELKEKK